MTARAALWECAKACEIYGHVLNADKRMLQKARAMRWFERCAQLAALADRFDAEELWTSAMTPRNSVAVACGELLARLDADLSPANGRRTGAMNADHATDCDCVECNPVAARLRRERDAALSTVSALRAALEECGKIRDQWRENKIGDLLAMELTDNVLLRALSAPQADHVGIIQPKASPPVRTEGAPTWTTREIEHAEPGPVMLTNQPPLTFATPEGAPVGEPRVCEMWCGWPTPAPGDHVHSVTECFVDYTRGGDEVRRWQDWKCWCSRECRDAGRPLHPRAAHTGEPGREP